MSVCLSDHTSGGTDLPNIVIGELVRPTEMLFAWFSDYKLSGSILFGKIAKTVNNTQVRVNGGSNF